MVHSFVLNKYDVLQFRIIVDDLVVLIFDKVTS